MGSQCSTNESDSPSTLVGKFILFPEGKPELAQPKLCEMHLAPWKNTSSDINDTFYYWHSSLGNILRCENVYREGQHILCSFALAKVKDSSFDQHNLQVMFKDIVGKIRLSLHITPLTSLV